MLDHILYVRESQGNDTFINYIFDGNVIVTHNETKYYINTLMPGDFFELDQEIQKRQKYVVDQGHLMSARSDHMTPTSGGQVNSENSKSLIPGRPTLLKFSLAALSKIFADQVYIQYEGLRLELMRFSVLNSLNTEEISYLATIGQSQTQVLDYLPNEIIVEEGYKNMDHFYLVV